ncbi:polygalacturonase-like [Phalaenopsis equestris]|uniref:polygalacturonase-like n=1 Tax=Phalaenopsis equestris TaxID=78828 RepID=UPI0009E4784A|nr:polygalacturonase-like [Phalaenopsis equestris]
MAANLIITFLLLFTLTTAKSPSTPSFNIINFGAKPDGQTDSAAPFLAAWSKACSAPTPATIFVPPGTYFFSGAEFSGPCKNAKMQIFAEGADFVAASGYDGAGETWITFREVEGLSIYGGTFDGRGEALWDCKMAGGSCPTGATSLSIINCNKTLLSGITSLNSQLFHVSIYRSTAVTLRSTTISAPGNSPNTDGIHIQLSSSVIVDGAIIRTGDDCISIKDGVSDVDIAGVDCGPGHGISIGSLGRDPLRGGGVRNVTVRSVMLTGTQNGVRIKTWAKENNGGVVEGVRFEDAVMNGVSNPIIVDQNYCPEKKGCPKQSSGIKIRGVSFKNIRGTSATKVAVKLDCSVSNPCSGIGLDDIDLIYEDKKMAAQSFCRNARGSVSGYVIPPSCL